MHLGSPPDLGVELDVQVAHLQFIVDGSSHPTPERTMLVDSSLQALPSEHDNRSCYHYYMFVTIVIASN